MNDKLTKLYNENNFPGENRLYNLAKQNNIGVTHSDIKHFLSGLKTYQLHKKNNNTVLHPITTNDIHNEYQIDLLDMSKFYKNNKGYHWILIIVDIYTRKAFATPLKNKTAEETLDGMKKGLDFLGKPNVISSDNGSEFKGKLATYLDENNIRHKTNEPGDHNQLGIIDRFSQTIKNIIYEYFTFTDDVVWWDKLDGFIKNYNDTVHSVLCGMTPNDALEHPADTRRCHYDRIGDNQPQMKIKVGDIVRILRKKSVFNKGYEINYTLSTYKVVSTNGFMITLDNGKQYKENQLQVVDKEDLDYIVNKVAITKKIRKIETKEKQEDTNKDNILIKTTRGKQIDYAKLVGKTKDKGGPEYQIEKITDEGIDSKTGIKIYKVYWVGYSDPTWEPYRNIKSTLAYSDYLKSQK